MNRSFYGVGHKTTNPERFLPEYSLVFNGSSSYVPSTIMFDLNSSFTWSLWVYPIAVASGRIQELISRRSYYATGVSDFPSALALDYLGTTITFHVDGGGDWSADYSVTATSKVNMWNHIVATYDRSYITLYVDGVYANRTATPSPPTMSGSRPLYIGRCSYENSVTVTYLNGYLSDVRLYNVVKSVDQIQTIKSGYYDYDGLVTWLKLNEGIGSTIYTYHMKSSSPIAFGTAVNTTWSRIVPTR